MLGLIMQSYSVTFSPQSVVLGAEIPLCTYFRQMRATVFGFVYIFFLFVITSVFLLCIIPGCLPHI